MKNKRFNLIIIFITSLLLTGIFLYLSKNSNLKSWWNSTKKYFPVLDKNKSLNDSCLYLMKIDSLQKRLKQLEIEEVYWKNRLNMAKNKSVDLAIDLNENMLILEMKGVILKKNIIFDYQISKSLYWMSHTGSLLHFLGEPLLLEKSWASIEKEPIIIKNIPKNPDEAYRNTPTEIPIDSSRVHMMLQFNKNFSLEILPQVPLKEKKWLIINEYDPGLFALYPDNNILLFEEYAPSIQKYWIKLYVDNNDARVIYRALSGKTELALRF